MKMKTRSKLVMLATLLMLTAISLVGCFRVVEIVLAQLPCPEDVVVETVDVEAPDVEVKTLVIKAPGPEPYTSHIWYYIGYYNLYPPPYQYPSLLCRWWYDKGQRCWWQAHIEPMFWPRPKPQLQCEIERRRMISRATKAGIDRYVDHGCPTGSFLRAVLENDLFEAVAKADQYNRHLLADICEYIYNYTPATCHGSPEKVAAWLKFHREKPEEAHEAAGADRERREHY